MSAGRTQRKPSLPWPIQSHSRPANGEFRSEDATLARWAVLRNPSSRKPRDYSKGLDAELKDRRERLQRTEERIKGLVGFIADGDRSEYVVATLRDLETQAKAERAGIERIHREAQEPLRLPSLDEITAAVFRFDALLATDVTTARARLRRWLKDGEIRLTRAAGGSFELRGAVAPLALVEPETKTVQVQELAPSLIISRSGGRI